VEKNLKAFYKDHIACAVIGMYQAFLAGVLQGFDKINFHVASSRHGEDGFRSYIESAVALHECTVTV
jgi:hypothetical protein